MRGLGVFSNLVSSFLFLSTMMVVFGFHREMHFTVFLVLPSKLHPAVALKQQFLDTTYSVSSFLLEEWMASLVCLAAVIWVVKAAEQKCQMFVYSGHALSYTKLVHRHATQTEGNKYFK